MKSIDFATKNMSWKIFIKLVEIYSKIVDFLFTSALIMIILEGPRDDKVLLFGFECLNSILMNFDDTKNTTPCSCHFSLVKFSPTRVLTIDERKFRI